MTGAGDCFGLDRLVARAALGKQKADDLLKRLGVRGVAKERALATHGDQPFVLQLVEVMRERRWRDAQLGADLADDEAFRMGRQQKPHDAQPRLGPERGEHVGVALPPS